MNRGTPALDKSGETPPPPHAARVPDCDVNDLALISDSDCVASARTAASSRPGESGDVADGG